VQRPSTFHEQGDDPEMALDTDANLVKSMLSGDQRAFDRFFADYFPRVFRFARPRLSGNLDATKDVVQSCLIKAVRSLAQFRGEAALFSWVCQICRHEICDYLRVHRRHANVLVSIDRSREGRAAYATLAAPAELNPDSSREIEESCRMTQSILSSLPENYRNALQWKYVEGRPVAEVAELLGTGHTAAQSLLARARESFRELQSQLLERHRLPMEQPR
jgi:RNA polymerase sigma-70 factor (ECF subfamily)